MAGTSRAVRSTADGPARTEAGGGRNGWFPPRRLVYQEGPKDVPSTRRSRPVRGRGSPRPGNVPELRSTRVDVSPDRTVRRPGASAAEVLAEIAPRRPRPDRHPAPPHDIRQC